VQNRPSGLKVMAGQVGDDTLSAQQKKDIVGSLFLVQVTIENCE
jgi:hypothetical protein